ncbi:MAG: diguanylate cyclase [Ruminococcus sp.]|jgi:diguanylate cyclase (GGDEF)-like protein|nr:diguanylate cyclase [Ruminococcus sp.]
MKTVFIVDDNQTNLIAAKNALTGIYRTLTVLSAAKMFQISEKIQPDIILLDIEMPEVDGFTAIKQIKTDPNLKDVPVIFLTAHKDEEIETKGFDLGAVDFITKPFSTSVLLKRIETHIKNDINLKETQSSLREVQNAAFLDSMTGLYNKNAYLKRLSDFCNEKCMPLGIISGDVNFLKRINDSLGHNAGDRLLAVIAETITKVLPQEAFAARTGGDELVILIPGGGKSAADLLVALISSELDKITDDIIGTPSVSFGTAEMLHPDETYEEIFALADERMYEDKIRRKAVRVG